MIQGRNKRESAKCKWGDSGFDLARLLTGSFFHSRVGSCQSEGEITPSGNGALEKGQCAFLPKALK